MVVQQPLTYSFMVRDMKVLVKQAILKACSWWGCYRVNCFSYIKTEKFSCPRENHRWYAGSQALAHHWAHMEVIPWRGKLLFGNSSLFHSKPFSSLSCLHVLLHLGTVRFVAKYKQAKLSSNDAGGLPPAAKRLRHHHHHSGNVSRLTTRMV